MTMNAGYDAKFDELIQNRLNRHDVSLSPAKPVCIFGAGNFGKDLCRILLAQGYPVAAFIETNPKMDSVLGVPVISWGQLTPEHRQAQLVMGIFNHRSPFLSLRELSREHGFDRIWMPWEIYNQFATELGWRFWLGRYELIANHLQRIKNVCGLFADQPSVETLYRVCSFRLGYDDSYSSFSHRQNHYFNELTLPAISNRPITYIDCGAYIGDTFLELSGYPEVECKTAYLFEPDAANYSQMVKLVAGSSTTTICMPLAVADDYTTFSFSAGNGDGSAISEQGQTTIAATSIDQLLPNSQADFIKMDIEGAELKALRGGLKLIGRSRPVMAISLYHRPEDIWEIPELIQQYCQDYRFYLRQHCYNSFELVLYAVPCEKISAQGG